MWVYISHWLISSLQEQYIYAAYILYVFTFCMCNEVNLIQISNVVKLGDSFFTLLFRCTVYVHQYVCFWDWTHDLWVATEVQCMTFMVMGTICAGNASLKMKISRYETIWTHHCRRNASIKKIIYSSHFLEESKNLFHLEDISSVFKLKWNSWRCYMTVFVQDVQGPSKSKLSPSWR